MLEGARGLRDRFRASEETCSEGQHEKLGAGTTQVQTIHSMSRRAPSEDTDERPAKKLRASVEPPPAAPSPPKPSAGDIPDIDEEEDEPINETVEEVRASDLYLDTVRYLPFLDDASRKLHREQCDFFL